MLGPNMHVNLCCGHPPGAALVAALLLRRACARGMKKRDHHEQHNKQLYGKTPVSMVLPSRPGKEQHKTSTIPPSLQAHKSFNLLPAPHTRHMRSTSTPQVYWVALPTILTHRTKEIGITSGARRNDKPELSLEPAALAQLSRSRIIDSMTDKHFGRTVPRARGGTAWAALNELVSCFAKAPSVAGAGGVILTQWGVCQYWECC